MASTRIPSGGLILPSMPDQIREAQQTQQPQPVIPQWSRPDDAERQSRLDAMKRRATALLAVALLVFVAASIYEPQFAWLGFVRATAEGSLVGGLADWFAVVAIFRHPLGLPIPHTAVIVERKDQFGAALGGFVQENFLSSDTITDRIRSSGQVTRTADWLAVRTNAETIAGHAATLVVGLADAVRDEDVHRLIEDEIAGGVDRLALAPLAARALRAITAKGRH